MRRNISAALVASFILCTCVRTAEAQYEWKAGFDQNGMACCPEALTVFDDGIAPALYAAGIFMSAGGQTANYIAKWDGTAWSPLSSGMNNWAYALAVFDDGNGPALYAGGEFTLAGGVPASHVAKWNGTVWMPLGRGVDAAVYSLIVFDDGTGRALYAGGSFTTAGGTPVSRIAKWDGTTWAPLSNGIGGGGVEALAVFDDGVGPALFAAGNFTSADGMVTNEIAKWDGIVWAPLGNGITNGLNGSGRALAIFNDGSGPALYVGGNFTMAGGEPANSVAKWDGTAWTTLGEGIAGVSFSYVNGFAVFDDGTGEGLYVGGYFSTAGGVSANNIAKWDGMAWTPLGSGIGGPGAQVTAVAGFDDGSGSALYVGGAFTTAGGVPSNNIAKWAAQ